MPLDEAGEREAPPDADPALHDALLRLDERQRLPVVLHYLAGYSVREIAKMLKLPAGTVKSRMRKARLELRDFLTEEGEDP